MPNDVDYQLVENINTGTQHLLLKDEDGGFPPEHWVTPCGVSKGEFRSLKMKLKQWWNSDKRCKNCERAAKR